MRLLQSEVHARSRRFFPSVAIRVAGRCGFSGRSAERGGGRRLVPPVSSHAGDGDAAGAGQRDEYGGTMAGAAYVDLRLSARHAEELAAGVADVPGGTAGRHGGRAGSAEYAPNHVSAPGAVAASAGGNDLRAEPAGAALDRAEETGS